MGAPVESFEFERASNVVDVGVGDEDLFELEAEGGEAAMDARDLVSWIDDDGFSRSFIAEQCAVALERADGEGLEDHGFIVRAPGRVGVARIESSNATEEAGEFV